MSYANTKNKARNNISNIRLDSQRCLAIVITILSATLTECVGRTLDERMYMYNALLSFYVVHVCCAVLPRHYCCSRS